MEAVGADVAGESDQPGLTQDRQLLLGERTSFRGANGDAFLPARRVVLLGASNVQRGIATVVETACRVWGRPLDLLAAVGHGRSYGMKNTVLVRTLPGIVECGLWRALAARPLAPTAALVTDIGNDLFYGASPPQIAGWVEECLDRLSALGATIVMTRMPVCNLDHVRDWQFRLVRSAMFPRCRLSLAELTERAVDLDARLMEISRQRGSRVVEPNACWYGFDPIHIKLRQWGDAWSEILTPWAGVPQSSCGKPALGDWLRLARLAPERRWMLGREQLKKQPCGLMLDGTVISLY